MDVKEDFLDEILSLHFVLKNPMPDIPDRESIAAKEQGESFTITYVNSLKKCCVVKSSRTFGRNSSGLLALLS